MGKSFRSQIVESRVSVPQPQRFSMPWPSFDVQTEGGCFRKLFCAKVHPRRWKILQNNGTQLLLAQCNSDVTHNNEHSLDSSKIRMIYDCKFSMVA